MRISFGPISLGVDHLTGPTADSESQTNTYATHEVARGKPVLQEVGSELAKRSFSFFFDEGFCDPAAELARLQAAFLSRSAAALVIPGQGYRGQRYTIDALKVTTQATTASGRVTRVEADIELIEDPAAAGAFAAIGAVFSALAPTVRR